MKKIPWGFGACLINSLPAFSHRSQPASPELHQFSTERETDRQVRVEAHRFPQGWEGRYAPSQPYHHQGHKTVRKQQSRDSQLDSKENFELQLWARPVLNTEMYYSFQHSPQGSQMHASNSSEGMNTERCTLAYWYRAPVKPVSSWK